MKIQSLRVKANFKYLWLKSVKGVDISQHCARCLIGDYDSRINNRTKNTAGIKLYAEIYYLCGVTQPFVYAENFHLAFKKATGKTLKIERNGIEIVIENAEEITFSQSDIDLTLPFSNKREYYTCRNWQFANKLRNTRMNVYTN